MKIQSGKLYRTRNKRCWVLVNYVNTMPDLAVYGTIQPGSSDLSVELFSLKRYDWDGECYADRNMHVRDPDYDLVEEVKFERFDDLP